MSTDVGSLITRTPGIVGGRPHIAGTRTTVSSVALCYKQGDTPEEIAEKYASLTIAQVYAALTYYHTNKAEIEAEIEADILTEKAKLGRLANEQQQRTHLNLPGARAASLS